MTEKPSMSGGPICAETASGYTGLVRQGWDTPRSCGSRRRNNVLRFMRKEKAKVLGY